MYNVRKIVKRAGKMLAKNSPHILTGLGCGGLISTAVLTGRAMPKAIYILEEEENYRKRKHFLPATKLDKVKLTWKEFIPAGAVGATAIACIIGANTVNTKRNAALAALYSLSETAFRDYKVKVVDEIGKVKEAKIRDEIAHNTLVQNPQGDRTIFMTGNGDVLCYDKLSDRYFHSSYETIRQKVNDLNYELITDMWLDLNDLYYALGLPNTKLGDQMGFSLEKEKIEIEYSTQLDPQGRPCLVIDTTVYPKHS